ncbi:hypothetical protein [Variovorax sp. CCNWLW186]|uniref:hypothetical protein n=1 Tax=Variovorax sp. CCNWLW186 TaxID=3127473 RepID=UPI003FD1F01D
MSSYVAPGCMVRATAEILVAWLPEWRFARERDPATGYAELMPRPQKKELNPAALAICRVQVGAPASLRSSHTL